MADAPISWTLHYINDDIVLPNLKEACREMMRRVMKNIETGMAWQLLEAIWITHSEYPSVPLMFHLARDIGAENGWFDDIKAEKKAG